VSTVIYDEKVSIPREAQAWAERDDLWIAATALEGITGWELKPEGLCRGTVCVPVPEDNASMVREQDGEEWVNLAAFARFIKQPYARSEEADAWYFGANPFAKEPRFDVLEAPDFELPDLDGRMHRLSDHKGKKVLLALWASW
jgi:hypothetical protein